MSHKFLQEAIRIGDNIISLKKESRRGYSWETMMIDNSKNITWGNSESIYKGIGGIVLYFVELYNQTSDEKYLKTAVKGADWLIDHAKNNSTNNYAFFTGRMGLSYVFSKVYRISTEQKYINEAVEISLSSIDVFEQKGKVDDLINGTSGTLLGLVLMYSETNEEQLLPLIERFTRYLIRNAYHGPNGLYWDKSKSLIRGLCGFSHGAAGVGYVFLQLGRYFQNTSFYWIAEQAFAYENHFFDKKTKNWPDFRKGIFSNDDYEEHVEAYKKGDKDFFFEPGNMMAWCHGAPGIGLSRLQALQLLNKEYLRKDIENSLNSTKKTTLTPLKATDTFTLCHGKGGNAMLFIEAYKYLRNNKAYDWAKQVASQALDFRERYGYYVSGYHIANGKEDISLFMGSAGLGYFYLMCNEPERTPSILAPRVEGICKMDTSSFNELGIPLSQLKKKILSKAYPKTISFIENSENEEDYISLLENLNPNNKDIKSNFSCTINYLSNKSENKIADLFAFETIKLNMELNTNPSFQYIKSIVLQEKAETLLSLSTETLLETKLKLNNDAIIYYGKDNGHDCSELPITLLQKKSVEIKEFDISKFTLDVLNSFNRPALVYKVVKMLLKEFEINNDDVDVKRKAEKLILDQIRECTRSLILINN